MALREFRSGALRNKYSARADCKAMTYIICFSSAMKFLAISSPALIFSLVLSFLSREKKERYKERGTMHIEGVPFNEGCSLSFARPKESELKVLPCGIPHYFIELSCLSGKKDGPRKWSRSAHGGSESSRPFVREAILINGDLPPKLSYVQSKNIKEHLDKYLD